jgi:hypothetical protein
MLPGNVLQLSNSRDSVAQGIDENSKGAGPRDRSRFSPALGATLVAHSLHLFRAASYNETPLTKPLWDSEIFWQRNLTYKIIYFLDLSTESTNSTAITKLRR